jgi:hypothetical protein
MGLRKRERTLASAGNRNWIPQTSSLNLVDHAKYFREKGKSRTREKRKKEDKRKKNKRGKIRINVFWTLYIAPYSKRTPNNTTFQKLDLFPSSGERMGDTYSVGSVQ